MSNEQRKPRVTKDTLATGKRLLGRLHYPADWKAKSQLYGAVPGHGCAGMYFPVRRHRYLYLQPSDGLYRPGRAEKGERRDVRAHAEASYPLF